MFTITRTPGTDRSRASADGKSATASIGIGGILNQALLDLAAWAERGVAPPPSSHYSLDAMNQVVLPYKASERHGLQPVVHLTANGKIRTEAGVNQPVNLAGQIEMPPGAGKVFQYDWYLGSSDFAYEPATKLAEPQSLVNATRTVSFPQPANTPSRFARTHSATAMPTALHRSRISRGSA